MKEYTHNNPVFSETIPITETTDEDHADNINAAPKQLIQNDLVLAKQIGEVVVPVELSNDNNLDGLKPNVTTFYYATAGNKIAGNPFGDGAAFGLFAYKNGYSCYVQEAISADGIKKIRSFESKWGDWKEVAYTDGTVAYAEQLKTARTISLTGDVDGNIDFDGSKDVDISVKRKGCCVGQSTTAVTGKSWYKFASASLKTTYTDYNIIFNVYAGHGDGMLNLGILAAHIRAEYPVGVFGSGHLKWMVGGSGIDVSKFVLAYKTGNTLDVELWVSIPENYRIYKFDVISEGTREKRSNNLWTLYDRVTAGGESEITSGYTQIKSELVTLQNPIKEIDGTAKSPISSSSNPDTLLTPGWYYVTCMITINIDGQGFGMQKFTLQVVKNMDDNSISQYIHSDYIFVRKYKNSKFTSWDSLSNVLINALEEGTAAPSDNDYYVSQYAGGGTDNTTYRRRPMYALFEYIKTKLSTASLKLGKGYYVHQGGGTSGTVGYVKIATFKISITYANRPVMLEVTRRGTAESTRLYIQFANASNTDPDLFRFTYIGTDVNAHMHKSGTSTWDLYVQKSEAYDTIDVIDYHSGPGSIPTLEWTDELVSSIPAGAVRATSGGNVAHADTASNCEKYLVPINIISGDASINSHSGTDVEISHGEVAYATYRFKVGSIKYDSITIINVILNGMPSIVANENVMLSVTGYKASVTGVDITVIFHNAHSSADVSFPNNLTFKIYYIDDDDVV